MVRREIDAGFARYGYRFCKGRPEEVGIYYKYYQEGFHVVMVIDMEHGYEMTPEQHRMMEERVMGSFYHPKGLLPDFPEGFPVYHVEVFTVLVAGQGEQVRNLCAQCRNVWAYLPQERKLLVYENQPGDFFGLRSMFEDMMYGQPQTGAAASKQRGFGRIKQQVVNGRSFPYVTTMLVVMNVIVYLVMELLGDTENPMFIYLYGGIYPSLLAEEHQWWRLITAGFIHFGIEHLLNNMVILYCMGSRVERIAGHWRMLVIYLLSLLGGSLLSYYMMLFTGDYAVSAGASGAIFGLIGGFLWMVIRNKGQIDGITVRGILIMILISVYYGFSAGGIDNWGHIGGLVTGFVASIFLYHRKCQKY